VAGNRHRHGVEQFAVMAGTAFDAQLIAMPRKVAHRPAIFAAHVRAMPWALAAGKGGAEQSGNKAVNARPLERFGSHSGSREGEQEGGNSADINAEPDIGYNTRCNIDA
jgi:hypothetical protein